MLASGLFWARGLNSVVVATDPFSCLLAAGRRPSLDADYLTQFAVGRPPEHLTPYVGVRRSPGGVGLSWSTPSTGSPASHDWCGPERWGEPDLDGEDAVSAYLEVFDATCQTLLDRCGVPVVAMSSGLDSTFIVGTLAGQNEPGRQIEAYVYRPLPGAAAAPQRGWLGDEGPLADLVAAHHQGRVSVHDVFNHQHLRPLIAAARAAEASGLPAANPSNQVWLTSIRQAAIAAGAAMWFVGTNGNAAFSRPVAAPAPGRGGTRAGLRRRLAGIPQRMITGRHFLLNRGYGVPQPSSAAFLEQFGLTSAGVVTDETPRERYLAWLRRRGNSRDAAANPAGTQGCLRADPFTSRSVIEVAARITDETWRFGGQGRGFARRLGAGRVPDAIRNASLRGAQGRDAWYVIRNDRDDYIRRVRSARDVPGLEMLDVDALVAHLNTWQWGQVNGPPFAHLVAVDRLLSVVDFAHVRGGL